MCQDLSVETPPPILDVTNLNVKFHTFAGVAQAVDGVSFHLNPGEIVSLVGESGCGKSVTANSLMRLIPEPPGEVKADRMVFDDIGLLDLKMAEMRKIRGDRISMIFQEPMTSLNPVFTVGKQISEMFLVHQNLSPKDAMAKSVEMLARVQMPAPEKRALDYPHMLSGGMRQRAMIAMAMACNPEVLIADEPTTALDVTIQAQVLDLMLTLKEDYQTAVLMITHDLGVIAEIARRVIVMYAGKIVEEARTRTLFKTPAHPYTKGLMASLPKLGQRIKTGRERLEEIQGIVPSLYHLPPGCSFAPRCPRAMPICRKQRPGIVALAEHHKVRCFLYGKMEGRK
jgi:peptide/nickel transport system ATP-binding protein/oligopeptide transport system ATP-binding protein